VRTTRTGGGSRGGGRDNRQGASSEVGAASVMKAGSEAEAFGALVEATVFLLMTLTSADKAGIIKARVRWGKDRIGLIKECFPSVGSFLGLLSM